MATRAAYREMLFGLLPPGQAWTRDPYSILARLLDAMASEPAQIDARAGKLLDEADPRTTADMLGDWEDVAGLPDSCSELAGTADERRRALILRITSLGGQTKAYFQGLAETLGYIVTIDEYRPFICGLSRAHTDTLNGGHEIRHTWKVTVRGARLTQFRTGVSRCGEKLLSIARAEDLECVLGRLKPAQSHLVFSYVDVQGVIPFSDSGQIPLSDSGQIPSGV